MFYTALCLQYEVGCVVYDCWNVMKQDDARNWPWDMFAKGMTRAVVHNVTGLVGMLAGSYIGMNITGRVIGMKEHPRVAVMVGDILGSIVGGTFAQRRAIQWTSQCAWLQSKSQWQFEHTKREALHEFNLKEHECVNEEVIKRRFRSLAKVYHPDRPTGSHDKWLCLVAYYHILLGIAGEQEQNDEIKKEKKGQRQGGIEVTRCRKEKGTASATRSERQLTLDSRYK